MTPPRSASMPTTPPATSSWTSSARRPTSSTSSPDRPSGSSRPGSTATRRARSSPGQGFVASGGYTLSGETAERPDADRQSPLLGGQAGRHDDRAGRRPRRQGPGRCVRGGRSRLRAGRRHRCHLAGLRRDARTAAPPGRLAVGPVLRLRHAQDAVRRCARPAGLRRGDRLAADGRPERAATARPRSRTRWCRPGSPGGATRTSCPVRPGRRAPISWPRPAIPGGAGFPATILMTGGSGFDEAIVAEVKRELGITLQAETMGDGYFDRLATRSARDVVAGVGRRLSRPQRLPGRAAQHRRLEQLRPLVLARVRRGDRRGRRGDRPGDGVRRLRPGRGGSSATTCRSSRSSTGRAGR